MKILTKKIDLISQIRMAEITKIENIIKQFSDIADNTTVVS